MKLTREISSFVTWSLWPFEGCYVFGIPVSAKDQLFEPFVVWVIVLFEKTYKFHKMPMFLFILMRFEAGVGSDF